MQRSYRFNDSISDVPTVANFNDSPTEKDRG